MKPFHFWRMIGVMVLGGGLAACTSFPPPPAAPEAPKKTVCEPVSADDPLVGNWLSKRQEKGVAGELRTLFTLQADGRMLYTEQIKRPRQPSQGLSENGCWWRDGDQLILKTLESNGSPVDIEDPIYENRYSVSHSSTDKLRLQGSDGVQHNTTRTSPGYRLPF
ncbi:hypothetical protein ACBP46_12685 [Paenalcaligenes hominis]|uniref:hypothetical protein n=1 Tax=Paenalcaligenes hominis TaxID=643674 RepID=UPI0035247757